MNLQLAPTLQNTLELVYSSDAQPGFTRRKWGRGFQYFDDSKQQVKCKNALRRIKQLAIPPVWEKVWICKNNNGHLQSTGRDARRRKQYIYHNEWIAYRQAEKFSKLLDFVQQLPQLRKTVEEYLRAKTWDRNKVLALAVKVMDQHHIRIGNKQYANRNGTYGLTTLRRKHIELEDGELSFTYQAKSNKQRHINIDSPRLVKLIRQCSELPGYEIFTYRGKSGHSESIDSSDVNAFIHQIMGAEFTAKDFRTWGGTSYAIKFLADAQQIVAKTTNRKLESTLVGLVAKELGNTKSVCKTYYMHPTVLKFIQKNKVDLGKIEPQEYLEDYEVMTRRILRSDS